MRRFTLIFSVAVTGCLFWGAASAAELQTLRDQVSAPWPNKSCPSKEWRFARASLYAQYLSALETMLSGVPPEEEKVIAQEWRSGNSERIAAIS
jgi:hypothetical protein